MYFAGGREGEGGVANGLHLKNAAFDKTGMSFKEFGRYVRSRFSSAPVKSSVRTKDPFERLQMMAREEEGRKDLAKLVAEHIPSKPSSPDPRAESETPSETRGLPFMAGPSKKSPVRRPNPMAWREEFIKNYVGRLT